MNEIQVVEAAPLTAAQVKAQVNTIQQIMKAVMKKDVHYGVIPGTQKPSLYKPGAEKLMATFHLSAEPMVEELSTPDAVRYRVTCKGVYTPTGTVVGFGIGEASSDEAKYRWRAAVCEDEWNGTAEDRRREKYGKGRDGRAYKTKQIRTEPADVANTILKIAKKRSLIDMVLTTTGASDCFDQDIEDVPPEILNNDPDPTPPLQEPKATTSAAPQDEGAGDGPVTTVVRDVVMKKGKNKKGNEFTLYIIQTDAGEYKTFSETLAVYAKERKGNQVQIVFTRGQYGNDATEIR